MNFNVYNMVIQKYHFDPEEIHSPIKGSDFHTAPRGPVDARMTLA